jgi:hypothetical protein
MELTLTLTFYIVTKDVSRASETVYAIKYGILNLHLSVYSTQEGTFRIVQSLLTWFYCHSVGLGE